MTDTSKDASERTPEGGAQTQARSLTLTPIGRVHSPFRDKRSAPRQPSREAGGKGSIELFAGRGYEDGLLDLDRFSHIVVLFWFDRADSWHPRVTPPRSVDKRGVFATRSPHRPNPIGLSILPLERVEGRFLHVNELDLLDGTPVLDIKPYIPYADARPDANHGWLNDADVPRDPGPRIAVRFSERAREQLAFLKPRAGFDLERHIISALELGAAPHAYRRIRRDGDHLRIGIRDFRVRFRRGAGEIEVLELATGYRASVLRDPDARASETTPLDVHRDFVARFGPSAAK